MTTYGPVRLAVAPQLKKRGTLTVAQAMNIAKCTQDEARNTLARMVRDEKATAEKMPNGLVRYHHVEKPAAAKVKLHTASCSTYRIYPPHHVRDELVAAFFGAPKQQGETA